MKNMYYDGEEKDFNESKLQKIKTMPIFAVQIEYDMLKANIQFGLENGEDKLVKRYLKAYEERLA